MSSRLKILFDHLEKASNAEGPHILAEAQELLQLARQEQDEQAQVLALLIIGQYRLSKGEFQEARKLFLNALKLTEQLSENPFKGRILSALGGVYCKIDQYGKSLKYLFEALNYIDPYWEGATYNTIGVIYRNQEQYEKAQIYFEKARIRAAKYKNQILYTSISLNIGLNYLSQHRYDEAIPILKEAVQKSSEIDYQRGQAYGLLYLLSIYQEKEQFEKALETSEHLLQAAKAAKDRFISARTQQIRAQLLLGLGKKEEGLRSLQQALRYTQEIDYKILEADIHELLSQYYAQEKQFEKAHAHALKASMIFKTQIVAQKDKESQEELFDREEQILRLEQQKDKIAQQNKVLKEFAYVVAHDLKEPLRNLSSFTALIHKRYFQLIDEEGKEYFQYIQNSARFMYDQLDDLLIYATIDDDSKGLQKVDLNKVFSKVCKYLEHIIRETQAVVRVSKTLPLVVGHEFHFTQILQNLIQNAIKFRHEDRTPEVLVDWELSNESIRFSVCDNGIGIEKSYHDHIFKIFKRLDKKNYSGTGIGLAICQKVVNFYNGQISVESTLGEGTNFHFSFPVQNFLVPESIDSAKL